MSETALRTALEEALRAINSMKAEAETAGAGGDEQMLQEACEVISNEGLAASMAIDAALALAAPAQAVGIPTVSSRLRSACANFRNKPSPPSNLITLLQQAADDIDALALEDDAKKAAAQPAVCETCQSLARAVMMDQVGFDRKPDGYGISLVTDDESIEKWQDLRTCQETAISEADDMMSTGRGETYEVIALYTSPQPPAQAQGARQPLTVAQVQKIVITVCDSIYPQGDASYSEADSVFYGAFARAIEAEHGIK